MLILTGGTPRGVSGLREWIPSPARGDKVAVSGLHFTISASCFFAQTSTAGSFSEQIEGKSNESCEQ